MSVDRLAPVTQSPVRAAAGHRSAGAFVTRDGGRYEVITDVDALAPFLMHVVGNSDVWLFAGSNGPFTAGRIDPDTALFPYVTADKLLRNPASSGALSVFRIRRDAAAAGPVAGPAGPVAGRAVWEPWRRPPGIGAFHRNLYKRTDSSEVVFEETDDDLGLRFTWSLSTCDEFGLVRHARLENLRAEPVGVEYLDGWHQILPPGLGVSLWDRYSYLAAAYMRAETAPDAPLGVYALNAAITDRPEANESLRSACAWALGHRDPTILLTDRQVDAFRAGLPIRAETAVRGEVGAFLVASSVDLEGGGSVSWHTVADTNLDAAALVRLHERLRSADGTSREHAEALEGELRVALESDRSGLRRRVAAADGLQQTADEMASVHHFTNVLFNSMRGGTFGDSYAFPASDFRRYLRTHNRLVAERHCAWLDGLPDRLDLEALRREVAGRGDPQLERLATAYLPLTFSRRHGDPSRPWNRFAIRLKDERGEALLGYEGNWRDIFQNWETIGVSFPGWLDAMIAVFLNASTADGYNPYRVTKDGVDWEVPIPDDPWSSIGYWGDHQLVYLERLLESHREHFPGRLRDDLPAERFAYVRVPYRIAPLERLLADPHDSISLDEDLHARLLARAAELGADGRLVAGAAGEPVLASLGEKLLLPLLVKLTNFVPGGGLWLNTQRPEWNDANNALAGWGLSVVTVAHARRYLEMLAELIDGAAAFRVSGPVATLLAEVTEIFRRAPQDLDDEARLRLLVELGRAGERHREAVYAGDVAPAVRIEPASVRALAEAVMPSLDATLRGARREDGLYDGYSRLEIERDGEGRPVAARVVRLYPMLEGQVAALSSGMLAPDEALEVLRALRASDLYRADQRSYLLYPDRDLTPLLERNTLPSAPPLDDPSLVTRDVRGGWHFAADLHNVADLERRLDAIGADAPTRRAVLDQWERTFHHGEFTGRSRTFFMFEGLGSIYWHMAAKLLLAVGETFASVDATRQPELAAGLAAAYDAVRDGLGFRKTAAEYGAFPADPYSHTPRHRGAQQPGMTGLVKEEILARWAELGVAAKDGRLSFAPRLLHRSEFAAGPTPFAYVDLAGEERERPLPAHALAFTCCGTPVCYVLADRAAIDVEFADGRVEQIEGDTLRAALAGLVFARSGEVRGITVSVPEAALRP